MDAWLIILLLVVYVGVCVSTRKGDISDDDSHDS